MGRTQRKRCQRKRTTTTINDPQNCIPALYKQLKTLGWRNETNLSISNFTTTGRGLCSKTKQFQADDVLMRLPLQCLISIATIEQDADFKAQFVATNFNKDQRIPFQCLMALYLLHQRHLNAHNNTTAWQAYLASLPTTFTTPYFCPRNELQYLPEAILEQAVEQNRKIRESFAILQTFSAAALCACCGQAYFNEIYALDDYKWAYFAVNTRSVYIGSRHVKPSKSFFQPLLADEPSLALAPLLDFFNHSAAVSTTAELVCNAQKQFEFIMRLQHAPELPIKPYVQIFISYGALTNFKLFTEYGFILPANQHDCFEFSLLDIETFLKSDKTLSQHIIHRNKFKFIREHNLHEQMFVHHGDGISHNMRVVLNLLLKEPSHYPNVLNQVAFGAADQLHCVAAEARLLLSHKVAEYRCFVDCLARLPKLSTCGMVAQNYLHESIRYLSACLEDS